MNIPIKLFFENIEVATISTFSYETPWASGKVKFIDENLFQRLVSVTTMLTFDLELEELELSENEEEKAWENKLNELSLKNDDLKLDSDGKWSIEPSKEGLKPIFSVRFYIEGFIDWRMS